MTFSPVETERLIGRYRGVEPGPTVLCVAGVHGNEPAGVHALRRIFDDLERLLEVTKLIHERLPFIKRRKAVRKSA